MILAIDPGPAESGFVAFSSRLVVKRCGVLRNSELRDLMGGVDHSFLKPACAIEWVESFGMPVGHEVFETCLEAGRFVERWYALTGVEPALVTRREVKLHLCQSARAKDPNVRRALIDKLGPAGTKKAPGPTYGIHGHLWSALAVAVTYAETKETK